MGCSQAGHIISKLSGGCQVFPTDKRTSGGDQGLRSAYPLDLSRGGDVRSREYEFLKGQNMFEVLQQAPPDPILGLTELFQQDPYPEKINLTTGVYKDESGNTPILDCVKQAEGQLLEDEATKSYLGIAGLERLAALTREMVFGAGHEILGQERACGVQTPGGTGALRVAADFVATRFPNHSVWCSQPTWANHPNVFRAAGLNVENYPYLDAAGTGLDFAALRTQVKEIPEGDVLCLHACCHNPTGVDLQIDQWREIGEIIQQRSLIPLVDFAYQGFGDGLDEDAAGVRELLQYVPEAMVCTSFSKNFGLYSERVGVLTVVATTQDAASCVLSHLKSCVRSNYSNPPKHGAAIVAKVLEDATLRGVWEQELAAMRQRISDMRSQFVAGMQKQAPQQDLSFITNQRGMFSYSGLSPVQVDALRNEWSIYLVASGRINVAGMTPQNIARLCEAVTSVL